MMVLRDSSVVLPAQHGAVVALGNFDGLHLGHQAVIAAAVTLARQTGKPAALMTFEPHPRRVFAPKLPPLRILPLKTKLQVLNAMNLDFIRIVRFTRLFAATSAEDFVTRILHARLHVSHVVTGEDFVFGHNREGNTDLLAGMAQKLGFNATACPAVAVEGARCSSTRVREALGAGDMPLALALLGRPYTLESHVRHGDKRGRTLGFPTANLALPPVFMPAYGVYAVRAKVQGASVNGVANLGMRPTIGGTRVQLEVHLFDWNKEIYGEAIEVELVQYLRGERKFDGLDALKAQIAHDSEQARAMLAA